MKEELKWDKNKVKDYKMSINWWTGMEDHINPVCELDFESIMFLFFYHCRLYKEEYESIREILGVDPSQKWTIHMSNNTNPPYNNIVVQRRADMERHNPTVVIYAGPNRNGDCYTKPNEVIE